MATQANYDQIRDTLQDVKDSTEPSRRMQITEEELVKARDKLKNAVMSMKEARYLGADVPGIETMGPGMLNFAVVQMLDIMNRLPRPPAGGRRRKTRKPRKTRKGRKGIFTRRNKTPK